MVTWSARRCVKHSNKNPDGNDDDTRLITLGASTRAASDWPAYLNYTPTTAAPRTTVPPSTSLATVEPALFHEGSSVSGQDTTTRPITDTKSSEQQHDGDEFFWVANIHGDPRTCVQWQLNMQPEFTHGTLATLLSSSSLLGQTTLKRC